MKHTKKYTQKESEKIRSEFLAGKSYEDIARDLGRTYGSVKNHVAHHWPELIKPKPYFKMKDDERKAGRNHPPSHSVEEALARGYKIAGVYDPQYNPMGIKLVDMT